jgi:hypothetical protein
MKRIKYIPYLAYNYNTNYGYNVNSNIEKTKNRELLFDYVLTLDPLSPL